ncbi:MAG: collagen-like protein [Oligoflexales bacterium]|nr:collagen-like protein [Oligoflexales bacterium]
MFRFIRRILASCLRIILIRYFMRLMKLMTFLPFIIISCQDAANTPGIILVANTSQKPGTPEVVDPDKKEKQKSKGDKEAPASINFNKHFMVADVSEIECNEESKTRTVFELLDFNLKYCDGENWILIHLKGDKGEAGADGKDGVAGAQGARGIQGEKGEKGDQGLAGINGEAGAKGDAGTNGSNGTSCSTRNIEGGAEVYCEDGSRSFIAAAGQLLVLAAGEIGEAAPLQIPSGRIVWRDADETILCENPSNDYCATADAVFYRIHSSAADLENYFQPTRDSIYFLSDDCSGQGLGTMGQMSLDDKILKTTYWDGNNYLVADLNSFTSGPLLSRSYLSLVSITDSLETRCNQYESVLNGAWLLVTYTLSPILSESVYPVQRHQLSE